MSTKHTASSRISSWDLLVELDNLLCLWCLAEKASGCGCSSHFWNLNWDNHLVHSGKHYIVIYYDIITLCTCVVYVSICGGMSIFWSTCMCMHPNDYCILLYAKSTWSTGVQTLTAPILQLSIPCPATMIHEIYWQLTALPPPTCHG